MTVTTSPMVLGTLGLAVLAVFARPLSRWASHVETLVHESGHALMLLATGNWPGDVVVDARGGGHTKLPDRPLFWPAAILSAMAGYTASPVAGLVLARGVTVGWSPAVTLGVVMIVLLVVVLFHLNWFGLAVMVGTGCLLAMFLWRAGPAVQVGAVVGLAWFLMLSGTRSLWQVAGAQAGWVTDFRYLENRTGVPAGAWFTMAGAIAFLALIAGARWLLFWTPPG